MVERLVLGMALWVASCASAGDTPVESSEGAAVLSDTEALSRSLEVRGGAEQETLFVSEGKRISLFDLCGAGIRGISVRNVKGNHAFASCRTQGDRQFTVGFSAEGDLQAEVTLRRDPSQIVTSLSQVAVVYLEKERKLPPPTSLIISVDEAQTEISSLEWSSLGLSHPDRKTGRRAVGARGFQRGKRAGQGEMSLRVLLESRGLSWSSITSLEVKAGAEGRTFEHTILAAQGEHFLIKLNNQGQFRLSYPESDASRGRMRNVQQINIHTHKIHSSIKKSAPGGLNRI